MDPRGLADGGLRQVSAHGRRLLSRISGKLGRHFVGSSPSSWDNTLEKLRQLFDRIEPGPDVLYLGDSVVERVSRDDDDRRDLGELVRAELSDSLRVVSLSHSACHMSVYYHILRCFEQLPQTPAVVVLHVNPRSFSPQWDLDPAYQFESEITALRAFASSRNTSTGAPQVAETPERYEEFDATRVSFALSPLESVGSFRLLVEADAKTEEQKAFRRRQILIFYYTYELDPSHRKVVAMREILAYLARREIRALVYVTPVNHEAGTKYVGSEFLATMSRNIAVLERVAAPYVAIGATHFVDWSTLLPRSCFFHANFLNEHLNIQGRTLLSRAIAAQVRQLSMAGTPESGSAR